MATVVYRNAVVLFDGVAVQAALADLAVEYAAEMLDETTFGDDTRINKGGLFTGAISGSGFYDADVGIEAVMWPEVGASDNVALAVFPDGVTEGSSTTGRGYAMLAALSELTLGGTVGELLGISFAAQSRGLTA